jgi:hypothetical protein
MRVDQSLWHPSSDRSDIMKSEDHSGDIPGETPSTEPAGRERRTVTRRLRSKRGGLILAALVTFALAGYASVGVSSAAESGSAVTADETPAPTPTASTPTDGGARSGPADGGATGIVGSTTTSSFIISTATGVQVTINETTDTTYTENGESVTVSAVADGESVLVLGLVDSAVITAAQVVVQPDGDGGAAASQAAGVIAFQQGEPSPDQSVGQIPDYTEGEGTIVSGATAFQAATAAQDVVPGGIADRVVQLADGEYEVHNISINWPHHVFVNEDFQVIGWN